MNIYQQIVEVCKGNDDKLFSSSEIKRLVHDKFGTNHSSIIPSDYCYNRFNAGIEFTKHIFDMIGRGEYKYLGENYPYTGLVLWYPHKGKTAQVVGEWHEGVYKGKKDTDAIITDADEFERESDIDISEGQIKRLYEEYREILELEISIFQCKPTESRHLIGRLGECKCALLTGGQLARKTNQAGFDVVSPDKRHISVKTTAQKSGFVSINKNTLDKVDDLMYYNFIRVNLRSCITAM